MKFFKSFLILLHLLILNYTNIVLANFGESCSPLPVSFVDNYLRTETAYGHILGNIDMKTYVTGACDPANEQFTFCLRMPSGSSQPCSTPIIMNVDETKRLGDLSTNPALGGSIFLKDINLTVVRIKDSICLTMPTSRGPIPLACKTTIISAPPTEEEDEDPLCRPIGNSCFDGHKKSQSLLNFSGVAVHCLKETLDKVFFKQTTCPPPEGIELSMLRPFPAFQETLKASIRAALIMYVIFFGFKMALNPGHIDSNQVATVVIKFILVVYFAVGLGPVFFQQGRETTENGMLKYVLPLLSQAAPELAQLVFGAGGSKGLCEFDPAKYQSGYGFYALWDSIDCRIGYYLGMQLLYNTTSVVKNITGTVHTPEGAANSTAPEFGPPTKEALPVLYEQGSFRFYVVLFGIFMSGGIILVAAGLIFSVIFTSILLNFLTSYLVCLITLYVMAYISPIFITFALFERTHGYFDAWVKITLSCVVQPAVLAGFVALLLTMYDTAIYKNCQFKRYDYTIEDVNFSTFELRVPEAEPEKCRQSAGYKFLHYFAGEGWEKINLILFPIYILRDVFNLLVEMFFVVIFTIIFYYFSKSISEFASEITNGPSMEKVTAGPGRVVQAVKSAGKFIAAALSRDKNKLKDSGKKEGEGKSRSGGPQGSGGGEAKDSASTGGSK